MDKVPIDVLRNVAEYLCTREIVSLQFVTRSFIVDKATLVKKFEKEPIMNTVRLFFKDYLHTYKIYSYVEKNVTFTDVHIFPNGHTFQCKHKYAITPSRANNWVLNCISDGSSRGCAYIFKSFTMKFNT